VLKCMVFLLGTSPVSALLLLYPGQVPLSPRVQAGVVDKEGNSGRKRPIIGLLFLAGWNLSHTSLSF
jgi:hypothetical protein